MLINDQTPDELLLHPGGGRGLELPEISFSADAYAGVAEPFPSSLIIPKSDRLEMIKQRKQLKIGMPALCDAAGLPVKDQQSTNYCVTEDTEVLTDRGWVLWPDYNGSDLLGTMSTVTGNLEFQMPTSLHCYEHDGPMMYSTHKSVDFGVTPDHRMLVRKWDESRRTLSDHYTFQRAGDVGWYFGLPPSTTGFVGTELKLVKVDDDREYSGDDFVNLIAMVVADGYAGGTDKTRNWVSFCCFDKQRQKTARELAYRVGFHESPSREGVWIRYDAAALANWFRANAYVSQELGAHNKRIPDLIKCASSHQIGMFLDTYGDRTHRPGLGRDYFSSSKTVIDTIQELMLRIGKRGTVWKQDNVGKTSVFPDGQVSTTHHVMHHVFERAADKLSISRKRHIETERYKGLVYCATVPNSTLITRRNGTILISGNCWVNAPVHCVEILRVIQNQKKVILSPASVGAPIKNFYNVGGWGKEALEYIVAHGVVPVSLWPANAINRKYYTQSNLQVAMDYRVDEWWVLEAGNLDQLFSCLFMNIPVAVGYSWWSHEVTAVDVDILDGDEVLIIDNSWGQSWGTNGRGMIQGDRMKPDDAVAPRTTKAA